MELLEHFIPLFDKITLLIAVNPSKKGCASINHRIHMIKEVLVSLDLEGKVVVDQLPNGNTVVDYVIAHKVDYIIRGIRNQQDFIYEQNLDLVNRSISSKVKTVYAITSHPEVSSSNVRELIRLYGSGWQNLTHYLTPTVANYIKDNKLYS